MPKNSCIMQIWAESGKSALSICNYSQILYQFLMFTKNLKRSRKTWTDIVNALSTMRGSSFSSSMILQSAVIPRKGSRSSTTFWSFGMTLGPPHFLAANTHQMNRESNSVTRMNAMENWTVSGDALQQALQFWLKRHSQKPGEAGNPCFAGHQ